MKTTSLLSGPRHLWSWFFPLFIFILILALFSPSIQNDFVNWDDDQNLLENENYRGLSKKHLLWIFTNIHMGVYQPVSWLLWAVEHQIWGLDPAGYHLVSLLLHATSAVVFYFIAMRLLGLAMNCEPQKENHSLRIASAVAALLFAIHPLRVEIVGWVSAQPYALSGLFFFLSILSYLKSAVLSLESRGHRRCLISSVAFFGLAFLSKAPAVTLPLILVILDVYPLQRLRNNPREWFDQSTAWIWWEKLPFLLIGLSGVVVGLYATSVNAPMASLGLLDRWALASYGTAFYLWKTINPVGLLPTFYELPKPLNPFDWPFLLSAAVALAISAGLIAVRRRWPAGLAIWASYLVMLAPNLGLIQHGAQLAANRYTYLSCLGWALLGGAGLLFCVRTRAASPLGKQIPALASALSIIVLIFLATLSWKMVYVWRDSTSLWSYTMKVDPENETAHFMLGNVFQEEGKWDEAIKHYEQALRIFPGYATAHNNLGNVLAKQGKIDETIKHYEMSIRIAPGFAEAHNNLAISLMETGRLDAAVHHYRQALRLNPDYVEAYYNLANTLTLQGRLDEAVDHYLQALQIRPNHVESHYNLATVLAMQGKLNLAVDSYLEAIQLQPGHLKAHNNLGIAYAKLGLWDEAIRHYEEAIRIDPDYTSAHYNLAMVYLSTKNFGPAWRQARILERLGDPSARTLISQLRKISKEPKS